MDGLRAGAAEGLTAMRCAWGRTRPGKSSKCSLMERPISIASLFLVDSGTPYLQGVNRTTQALLILCGTGQ
ncbi:hypothetical protein E2C01_012652 [Portunus trituberculatus]|uniref:Uncharacterized protein n=1 Tax=Portunus trituberculatus TaxID=210409 RepID=A0A5B7DF66_PORTR|nr:hypothetical protein [Portunus trituberculatus]